MSVKLKVAEFDLGARWTSGDRVLHFSRAGNLELWDTASLALLWESGTAHRGAKRLEMQSDGNLVIYAHGGALWDTATSGNEGASLILNEGGGAAIVSVKGVAVWRAPEVRTGVVADTEAPAARDIKSSPESSDLVAETHASRSTETDMP